MDPPVLGLLQQMRDAEVKGLRWNQVSLLEDATQLHAGETKNDEGHTIPIVPALRVLLVQQHANAIRSVPYVCFRLDRGGHAAKISCFGKAWIHDCIRAGLGQMEPVIDSERGKLVLAKHRVDRPKAKPKVKTKYVGRIFHDLRRSAVRFLDRAHVSRRWQWESSGTKQKACSGAITSSMTSMLNSRESVCCLSRSCFPNERRQFGDNLHRNAVWRLVKN